MDRMTKGEIKYASSKGKIFTVNLNGDTYIFFFEKKLVVSYKRIYSKLSTTIPNKI